MSDNGLPVKRDLWEVFAAAYLAFIGSREKPEHSLYMVLDDGETFSALPGCRIVQCPDGSDIEELITGGTAEWLIEFMPDDE